MPRAQTPEARARRREQESTPEAKAKRRTYRVANLAVLIEKNRAYVAANPEATEARRQKWYGENGDIIRSKARDYSKSNRKKINDRARLRLATNVEAKLAKVLRIRILGAFRDTNNREAKDAKSLDLTGCTIGELKAHLESLFKPGMTWKNHTNKGWHIDHIRPCSSFDLSDPEQQRACFHYTNLQPLWWVDNLSKGDKHLTALV